MFEEIGWTPIRLRRWLRVKRSSRSHLRCFVGAAGDWTGARSGGTQLRGGRLVQYPWGPAALIAPKVENCFA